MPPAAAADAAWATLLQRPAVRVAQEHVDVGDLVLLGILTGDWKRFSDDARRGVALAENGAAEAVEASDLRAAATAFRYARGLVSASEFTTWLRERELTLADLSAVLVRQLLDERAGGDSGERAGDDALAAVLRVEAYCRGTLDALADGAANRLAAADRLAERAVAEPVTERVEALVAAALDEHAAALPALGEEALRWRCTRLVALDESLSRLRAEVASPQAVAECLAGHRLDWLRLRGQELALAELGAAREARLLMRDDGLTLEEVAARAGAIPRGRTVYLEDIPADARAAFAAAAPGELVGPWLQDAEWRVLALAEKSPPAEDDALLAERANDELLSGMLERHRAGRTERLCVL